jgi:glycosyltransferase involved in cell wall biosynthesis
MVPERISVIVTTFNRADALEAVLRGLARQTDKALEVIVADDGSGPATRALVERWKSRFDRSITHVWHEDRGFRAAEIRNQAILASRGDYCVFLDGDCIPRRDFVATHRRLAEAGWFVTGNRVLLARQLTERVLRDRLEPEAWELGSWIVQRWRGGINRLPPVFRLPLGALRRLRAGAWRGARSCNIGIWRSDLERVDGFDAAFEGWGREDSDLFVRLLHAGVRRKDGVFATGVLHLWHPEADRSQLPENERKLEAAVRGDLVRAQRGLSALTQAEADAGAKIDPPAGGHAQPRDDTIAGRVTS